LTSDLIVNNYSNKDWNVWICVVMFSFSLIFMQIHLCDEAFCTSKIWSIHPKVCLMCYKRLHETLDNLKPICYNLGSECILIILFYFIAYSSD
jgi:hypothetical protein